LSTYESRENRYIGLTPTHVPQEQLLDYFLYSFEFVWTAPVFDTYKHSIRGHFKGLLEELKGRQEKPFTIGQEWWSLVLLALKDLAHTEKYSFSTETIQFLLNSVHTLTDVELEDYANSINNIFFAEMPDVMSLRPLEISPLSSDASKNDHVIAYFLEHKDAFLEVFTRILTEADIEKMYINELTMNEDGISEAFTTFWNVYYEIFTGFSISMFDMVKQTPENEKAYREQVLREVNLVFLIASVKNNTKIDKLNDELTKLILPLYFQDAV
jgi:hypothetical protein